MRLREQHVTTARMNEQPNNPLHGLTLEVIVTELVEQRVALGTAVRGLSDRERRLLYLRFFEDRTQAEIGQDLGVSQMQVSRLLSRLLGQLREEMA